MLFKELDFATDAQTIAQGLNELNAKAYLDSAKISLDFQEELNKEALSEYANEWQSFVTPFELIKAQELMEILMLIKAMEVE